jgi:hypothetical protein
LNIITNKDLVEVTSEQQSSNGTRMFYDNRTGVMYGSYSNGDVRRLIPADHHDYQYTKLNFPTSTKIMSSQARLALINQRALLYKGYQGSGRQRFINR